MKRRERGRAIACLAAHVKTKLTGVTACTHEPSKAYWMMAELLK
jgi:hypothetical protein